MKLKPRAKKDRVKSVEKKMPELNITGRSVVSEEDTEFVALKDNLNFSPERNMKIIKEVAQNNWKNSQRIKREYLDKVEERADAVETFINSPFGKGARVTDKVLNKYFGEKELLHLRNSPYDKIIKG